MTNQLERLVLGEVKHIASHPTNLWIENPLPITIPETEEKKKKRYHQSHQEYESLPEELRAFNNEYSQLIRAVELGYLSRKLIDYAWKKSIQQSQSNQQAELNLANILDQHFTQTIQYEPNQRIFKQNDLPDKIYLLKSGEVDIILEERSGNKKLATLKPNSIFGEMAVIDEQGRSASAYARGQVTAQVVKKEYFQEIIDNPEDLDASLLLVSHVVTAMKNRRNAIRATNSQLRDMINKIAAGIKIEDLEEEYEIAKPIPANGLTKDEEKYHEAVALRKAGEYRASIQAFCDIDTYYEINDMCTTLDYTPDDYARLRDHMLDKGLLAGMLRFGKWNPEHCFRNRRYLFEIMEKSNPNPETWIRFGDIILKQHPGRKITLVDCELALEAYENAGHNAQNKIQALKAYAKEKEIPASCGTSTDHEFVDLNIYQQTPGIDAIVEDVESDLSSRAVNTRNIRIALNFQRACALEPLSDKTGCTTRYIDLSKYQRLEQFVVAGVNVGYALFDFLSRLEQNPDHPVNYDACYNMQVLSKLNRRGGRLNQGIIEFGFPLIAAIALYDPECEEGVDYICGKATEIMKSSTIEDVQQLMRMKQFAYILSRVERDVITHDVDNVYDYYSRELETAEEEKNLNSIIHNRQFVQSFPDIRLVYEKINQSEGNLNDRAVAAYNQVFSQEHYQELGRGLAADFIAVGLFLTFCYHRNEEIVW